MKIFIIVILALATAWGINYYGDTIWPRDARHEAKINNALMKTGDECVSIAERASAHLVPKLEFQRLELEARKANVVVRCMADRNYRQSPAWLRYAEPIAARMSADQNISRDEALEKLKRKDMLIFQAADDKPLYWQAVKTQ